MLKQILTPTGELQTQEGIISRMWRRDIADAGEVGDSLEEEPSDGVTENENKDLSPTKKL